MRALFVLGRAVFGGFFVYNGINHLQNLKTLAGYAGSKGVPAPEAAVAGTGALMLAGGASIVLGVKPQWGALAVLTFLAGVSPAMHDFWKHEDPNQRSAEMINFTKNMALLGGALALMGIEEPWPVSVPVAQPHGIERVRRAAHLRRAA